MNALGYMWTRRQRVAHVLGRHPLRAWRTYRRLLKESRGVEPYGVHGDPDEADCAVFFCSSDRANKDMAWNYLPMLRAAYPSLPFIVSPEILDLYVYRRDMAHEQVWALPTSMGTRSTTLAAARIMEENEWSRPLLGALNWHVSRMDAMFRQLGYDTITPDDLDSIRLTTTDSSHERRWRRKQPLKIALHVLAGHVKLDD
jgi:uncharacterized SAM-binding protein YcdF (DUF218 family)